MLNRATCRLVFDTDPWLWIRGSWIRRPPAKRAIFSKVGLFRSCAPNLEKRRAKGGPTQISKQFRETLKGQLRAGAVWKDAEARRSAGAAHGERERDGGEPTPASSYCKASYQAKEAT